MTHIGEPEERDVYQIRVKGALDDGWSCWFDGLDIKPQANGDTLIVGAVRDQAALHGLLARVRDLGVILLSVSRIDAVSRLGE